jgi:hypothetical protein
MPPKGASPVLTPPRRNGVWLALICLTLILGFLFRASFKPGQTLFANDGPLAALQAEPLKLPDGFTGIWQDLNWVGTHGGSAVPNFTFLLLSILKPIGFSKFYGPLTLLFFGVSVFVFLRQLRFHPMVCALGAIAAALNMDVFSNVCWGLGTRAVAFGAVFFALAAIVRGTRSQGWLQYPHFMLAGLCVGLGLEEGADVGVIFSLCVAAFTMIFSLCAEGSPARNAAKGVARTAIVALFAGLMSLQAITALLHAGVVRAVTTYQQTRSWQKNWDWATKWSLPKIEAARVIIPGLFGYRMDTPGGGEYWGTVGQQPGWEESGVGFARSSGSGEYAGVLVVLIALWAMAASFGRDVKIFSAFERKLIWFWGALALVSLLLAFGRHAPFYRLLYPLPFFSTIRNPIKFMHPFHLSLLILFAYGLQGLSRRYLETAIARSASFSEQLKTWWANASSFERKWSIGSGFALGLSVLGYLIFVSGSNDLQKHLASTGFDEIQARAIVRFSHGEFGWYLLFLILSVAVVLAIMSGALAGRRAKWAGIFLGLILVTDLGRANQPWIIHYDYRDKLATNPVIDFLRDKPYEHRVAVLPFQEDRELSFFQHLYHIEWLQQHFQAYNIQAIEFTQEPRQAPENAAFRRAVSTNIVRLWELTNTRYVLGLGGYVDALNMQLDPGQRWFKLHTSFDLVQAPTGNSILARTNANGPFALIEFSGALPRAKLYARWQVDTNDQTTLDQLANPSFDPAQFVLVAGGPGPPPASSATNQNAGPVEITSYSPKRVLLRAQPEAPSVLLLNDKHDPDWRVRVDGQPAPLLRCNYLMRGVYLSAGSHTVEFHFEPPRTGLYASLAALAIGLVIGGVLFVTRNAPDAEERPPAGAPAPIPAPQSSPAPPRADVGDPKATIRKNTH